MNGSISFLRPTPAVEKTPADLDGKLVWLKRFGQPNIFCHDDGTFSAKIQMHVAQQGASFNIRSDYHHDTPTQAVDQMISRMLETLAQIGKV